MTLVLPFLLLVLFGGLLAWAQRRTQRQIAALPPDALWRMKYVFPAVMLGIVAAFFVFIYLVRPHA